MDISDKIVNPGKKDYHMHSFTYSDGAELINRIVEYAGQIGLEEIAITDHSQHYLEKFGYQKKTSRGIVAPFRDRVTGELICETGRWRNVFDNNVNVIFGVEADILNEKGDICTKIQGKDNDFIVLSAHRYNKVYEGDCARITEAYLNAIKRFHNKIKFLGHLASVYFEKTIDVMPIIDLANHYNVPIEFNGSNLYTKRTNMKNLMKVLNHADQIYINSDAHTLYELKEARNFCFEFLEEKGLWVRE